MEKKMSNSAPALPMLARHNDDGVSVNESALCVICVDYDEEREASYRNWKDAEDTNGYDLDDQFYLVDNPDAVCNGCGARALWEHD